MEHLTNRPLVIGIAGGSGCGKTHLANEIAKAVGEENVLVLSMDQYFINTEDPNADSANVNFDHPRHVDFALLLNHIRHLQEGKPVFAPGYDFRNKSLRLKLQESKSRVCLGVRLESKQHQLEMSHSERGPESR